MEKKTNDITDKFGAATILKMIIDSLKKSTAKEPIPGTKYLLEQFEELYKQINFDIFADFSGVINQLKETASAEEKGDEND